MLKIFITGGAGFIGSTLANSYIDKNQVVVLDDLSMGKESNLIKNKNLTFIKGSVTDAELVSTILKENQFDYIYHLAAIASVADSVKRPVETHKINFESVLTLLEAIRSYNPELKRLIFASSAAVYGDEPTLPKQEESVIRPLTPYAIDKFAAEKYVLAYNNLYNVPTSAVRFFNVYGPNQNPASPYSGVISIIVEQFKKSLAGESAKFCLFGDGSQSRDFVYVEDVVAALKLFSTQETSKGEVYNIGTGIATSLKDLLTHMQEILKVELPIVYEAPRSGDIPHSYAQIDKVISLGFESAYTVKDGLADYLSKVLVNQANK